MSKKKEPAMVPAFPDGHLIPSGGHPESPAPATVAGVNRALKDRGVAEKLVRGKGYYYFTEGEAMSWPSSSVMTNRVGSMTVAQWLAEYEALKAEYLP